MDECATGIRTLQIRPFLRSRGGSVMGPRGLDASLGTEDGETGHETRPAFGPSASVGTQPTVLGYSARSAARRLHQTCPDVWDATVALP